MENSPSLGELILDELFPSEFSYKLISCSGTDEKFNIQVRCCFNSKESVDNWIEKFSEKTGTRWVVRRTFPEPKRYAFRIHYVCHHSGANRKQTGGFSSKVTNCESNVDLKIKHITASTIYKDPLLTSKDESSPALPGVITLNWQHNHTIGTARALSFLKPTETVRGRFIDCFNNNMTASMAIDYYRAELELR